MKKDFISFLCFLPLLFSLSLAEDGGYGVQVRSASPELVEVEPGRIVTGSFLVTNDTEEEEEFIEELKLPADWQEIISDEFPLRLKPEEKRVRVVAFLVPLASPADRYQVSYSIRSQRDYNITKSDSISVVVLPLIKLEILVEEKPEAVIAGEEYKVKFLLVNKGNTKTKVKLKAKSNPVYPLEIEPSQVTLDLKESQTIGLEVKTDEKLNKRIKNVLEIKAETEESKNGAVSIRQTVSVAIIPKVTGELDPYHKLPVKIGLIGAGKDKQTGFQIEFSGWGSLDEEGKRKVEFLFRGPDIQDISRHGKRDEFRLSYRQKHIDLHFGDRSYSLSPLTQRFSYGRGVEADIHLGKFGLGAFYVEDRWKNPKSKRAGTYLGYRFSSKFNIKGNVLSKREGETFSSWGDGQELYSVQAEIKPSKTMNLELEFGSCQKDRQETLGDLAFRVNLDGQLSKKISYSFEKIYADPEYFGYYKDVNYTTGVITFPIYHKLRGNLSYRTYENNLDLDSTEDIANREKSYQASILYSFPFGTHLSLKYEDLIREDYALPANYDYQEKTLELGLVQTFGKFSLSTHMERGEFKDRLLAKINDDLERYNLYASFRPNQRQNYSFFARIGHNNFTQNPEWTRSAGISTRWYIKDKFAFSLNYRKDNAGSEKAQERDDLFSTFTYTLKNNHILTLRAQWSKYEQKKNGESSFLLMYTIPFKLPISKKKSIGTLKGKVHDEEKTGKPPIPEVILTAHGATAITNENGQFIFPSLLPGAYYLRVEKNTIGLNRVTNQKMPIIIDVKGGEVTEIEIGVVTSCGISGGVAVFDPGSDKNIGNVDTSIIFVTTTSHQDMEKVLYPEPNQPALSTKLLKTKGAISVTADVSFVMGCFKGSEKRVYFSGKEVFLKSSSEGIILSEGEGEKFEEKIERVVFIPKNKKSCYSLNGKDYKGILEVIYAFEDSSLLALNWSRIEEGGISEFEALKAQAVTASGESPFLMGTGEQENFEKDDLRKGRGLSNTLVEITDGEEILRQLTDQKSKFSFQDIRPGKWTLKVYNDDLPAHHYLEQKEFKLVLKPGEEKELMVKVLPRHRPIQIIDEGKIEQENK